MKKENEILKLEVTSLKLAATLAVQTANDAVEKVPKPATSNFSIYVAMGFVDTEDDQKKYCGIQRTVHDVSLHAGISFNRSYRDQPSEIIAKIFKACRQAWPELARYENNWATAALLQQFITNRRKYLRSKGFLSAAPAATATATASVAAAPAATAAAATPVGVVAGGAVPNIADVDAQVQGEDDD